MVDRDRRMRGFDLVKGRRGEGAGFILLLLPEHGDITRVSSWGDGRDDFRVSERLAEACVAN
jgi:hypothetical protein